MSDALKVPARRERKPPKPAREVVPFAFPKPSPKRPPLDERQHRRKPIKQRRETERRSGRERDEAHLDLVRGLGYCCCDGDPEISTACRWRWNRGRRIVEADHLGPHPKGRKSHDKETGPMCWGHHFERTKGEGAFWGWTLDRQRAFRARKIMETLAEVDRRRAA